MRRWAALAAAVAALMACARAPETPDLVFPSEIIQVTGRSAEPIEALSVGQLSPAPLATESPRLPIPSPMGVFTPVRVTAEATPRLAALEPRLASMLAREEARMAALARAAEAIAAMQAQVELMPASSPDELEEALASQVVVWEDDQVHRAELTWSPLDPAARPAPAPSITAPPASPDSVPHLSRAQREALEGQAREQAVENLKSLLLETEIQPGVSLRGWLLDRSVDDREFDELLEETPVARRDHWQDSERSLHVCEVELRFDYSQLNSLR